VWLTAHVAQVAVHCPLAAAAVCVAVSVSSRRACPTSRAVVDPSNSDQGSPVEVNKCGQEHPSVCDICTQPSPRRPIAEICTAFSANAHSRLFLIFTKRSSPWLLTLGSLRHLPPRTREPSAPLLQHHPCAREMGASPCSPGWMEAVTSVSLFVSELFSSEVGFAPIDDNSHN
jgi:hypothetical protein